MAASVALASIFVIFPMTSGVVAHTKTPIPNEFWRKKSCAEMLWCAENVNKIQHFKLYPALNGSILRLIFTNDYSVAIRRRFADRPIECCHRAKSDTHEIHRILFN